MGLIALTSAAADSISRISLPTQDLIYDPFSQKIYASVPSGSGSLSDSIVPIDPFTVTVGAPIRVGADPGKLALSDDGRYLYVALNGSGAIRRVDMATLIPDLLFSLGSNPRSGATLVQDMEVLPGHPESLAVSRMNIGISPAHEGVVIYDNGVPRPVSTEPLDGSNVIQFAASPARLYGYNNESTASGFRRMLVDSSGVSVLDVTNGLIHEFTSDMKYDGGLLYMTSGLVIDPEARSLVGTFPGLPYDARSCVAPDGAIERVFFLIDSEIQAYNARTFLPVGATGPAGATGTSTSLIRWGVDGLAFRTNESQVYLIRTALIPSPDISLAFYPATVTGGRRLTGRLVLRQPAPPGGVTITLASDHPAVAAVPGGVMVPAGAVSATFPVATPPAAADTTAVISASGSGAGGAGKLQVLAPFPAGLTLSPAGIIGGGETTGTLTLTGPAPAGGLSFTLASDYPATTSLPASVTIPAGADTATFPVTVQAVRTSATVTLTASGPAGTAAARLAVDPPQLVSLTLMPNPVAGGEPVVGTVELSGPAPAGGALVPLFQENTVAADMPASVTVPAGAREVTFSAPTHPVSVSTRGLVIAQYGGDRAEVTLEVLAPPLLAVTLQPARVTGGAAATGTVMLGSPAPEGGLPITLSSSEPAAAQIPGSVMVPAGESQATFTVPTGPVVSVTVVTITASHGGVSREASLSVLPPLLYSLIIDPAQVTGGTAATGTITLSGAAPPGGTMVTLASSDPAAATVPARVTVPAGGSAVPFGIETRAVSAATPVLLFAAAGGLARATPLTVLP